MEKVTNNISQFLKKKVIVLAEDCTAEEAAKTMAHQKIGSVLVKNQKQIIGIVTDRDLTVQVLADQLDQSSDQCTIFGTSSTGEIWSYQCRGRAQNPGFLDWARALLVEQ